MIEGEDPHSKIKVQITLFLDIAERAVGRINNNINHHHYHRRRRHHQNNSNNIFATIMYFRFSHGN